MFHSGNFEVYITYTEKTMYNGIPYNILFFLNTYMMYYLIILSITLIFLLKFIYTINNMDSVNKLKTFQSIHFQHYRASEYFQDKFSIEIKEV